MKTMKYFLSGLSAIALLATCGCASFKMVRPDGTMITGASVMKEINVSRKEKNANGYECTETYKSKVDSESVGSAAHSASSGLAGTAGKAFLK
jgi:hypothetical protein